MLDKTYLRRRKLNIMKKIVFILAGILFSSGLFANIIRLNNNAGVLGTYLTAQAAHNAASAGDTIHVETSVFSYGNVTCTKPLVWIGNGYFQDGTKASYLDYISMNAGSGGSVLLGLYCADVSVQTSNISIQRASLCNLAFYASTVGQCSNFNITQSFVRCATTVSGTSSCSGFNFTNTIFYGMFTLPSSFTNIVYAQNYFHSFNGGSAATATNNIFREYSGVIALYASTVYNNLFVGSQTNSFYVGLNGNLYSNTSVTSTANTVFVSNVTTSTDNWVNVKLGGPAYNNGLGGTHIGPIGGSNYYRLGGIPPVPSFTQFQIQGVPVNTLPVIISTKSNN